MQHDLVFFDGYCNLCSSSVQFILKRDSKKRFKFASLQGNYAKNVLGEELAAVQADRGIVLKRAGKLYTESDAALQIAKKMDGAWPMLFVFWCLPKGFRDFIYNWIAKNRYKWFGQKEVCWIPEGNISERFL